MRQLLLEISFALNVGYSTVVTLRRERLSFFDAADMLRRRGLLHVNVSFFVGAVCNYMRRVTAMVNRISLPIMATSAVASLVILFWGASAPDARLSTVAAAFILLFLMLPPVISVCLSTLIISNCRQMLSDLIEHYHSENFLLSLNEFVREDSFAPERIDSALVASWSMNRRTDASREWRGKNSVDFWFLLFSRSLKDRIEDRGEKTG